MSDYSNPGYVFADWEGIEDDDESYAEVPILRKYNYRLETGTVGTDDDNIANVLYNINRMEMTAEKEADDFDDEDELDEALGDLFFMLADIKVHLTWFLEASGDKTNAGTARAVIAVFDEAIEDVRSVRSDQTDDMEEMAAAFPKVYKKLLAIVPSVLDLDNQATGRV